MAQATRETKTIFRPVEQTGIKSVTLELTPAEAIALRFVLSRIGGPPNNSARYWTERVNRALTQVGVPGLLGSESEYWTKANNRAIYFTPDSETRVLSMAEEWQKEAQK